MKKLNCRLFGQKSNYKYSVYSPHRTRIRTEEKAKVVTAIWGTELIKFIAALAILHQDDLKMGMNSSYSSFCPSAIHSILQIVLVQNSYRGRNEQIQHPKQQQRPLPSLPFSMIVVQ